MYQFIAVPCIFCLVTKSNAKELRHEMRSEAFFPLNISPSASDVKRGSLFPNPTQGTNVAIIVRTSVGLAMSRNPTVQPEA